GENPSSIYDRQDALHEAAPVPHAAEKMAGRGSDRPTGTHNRVPSGARRREPAGDAPRDRRRALRPDRRENPRGRARPGTESRRTRERYLTATEAIEDRQMDVRVLSVLPRHGRVPATMFAATPRLGQSPP